MGIPSAIVALAVLFPFVVADLIRSLTITLLLLRLTRFHSIVHVSVKSLKAVLIFLAVQFRTNLSVQSFMCLIRLSTSDCAKEREKFRQGSDQYVVRLLILNRKF